MAETGMPADELARIRTPSERRVHRSMLALSSATNARHAAEVVESIANFGSRINDPYWF